MLFSFSTLYAQENRPETIDGVLKKVFDVTLREYRDSFGVVKPVEKIDSTQILFADPIKKVFHTDILIKDIHEDLMSSKFLRYLTDEEIKEYYVVSYSWLIPVTQKEMKSIKQKNSGDVLTEQEWFTIKKRLVLRNKTIDEKDPPTLLIEVSKKR